ncbi:MAG TPA: FecR domain-containing protein [Gemmatimonadaceae bacterium]|nr:FecR domain-containing protein [Gemmatimonadaceae bacterium]
MTSLPHDPAPDWTVLARHLDGESDAAESERVRRWLAAHPGDAEVVAALEAQVGRQALGGEAEAVGVDVEAALRRVNRVRVKDPTRLSTWRGVPSVTPWRRWRVPVLAAAGLVVAAAGLWLTRDRRGPDTQAAAPERAPVIYVSNVGARQTYRLPDSSVVVLGPRSTLTESQFDASGRVVTLEGEAHFVVRHDARRPFMVRAGSAAIVDIGTAFVVRTEGPRARVAVTEGVVELRPATGLPASGAVLRQGDVGILGADGRAEVRRGAVTAADTAWLRDRLVFRDAPMHEVARELERWYGVHLVVADSSLARLHHNGDYARGPVAQVLEGIATGLGARLERRGDTAVLRRR